MTSTWDRICRSGLAQARADMARAISMMPRPPPVTDAITTSIRMGGMARATSAEATDGRVNGAPGVSRDEAQERADHNRQTADQQPQLQR